MILTILARTTKNSVIWGLQIYVSCGSLGWRPQFHRNCENGFVATEASRASCGLVFYESESSVRALSGACAGFIIAPRLQSRTQEREFLTQINMAVICYRHKRQNYLVRFTAKAFAVRAYGQKAWFKVYDKKQNAFDGLSGLWFTLKKYNICYILWFTAHNVTFLLYVQFLWFTVWKTCSKRPVQNRTFGPENASRLVHIAKRSKIRLQLIRTLPYL